MSKSSEKSVTLVEFKYGDELEPEFYRITNSNSQEFTWHGEWHSDPALEIEPIISTGTLDDNEVEFTMSQYATNLTFPLDITSGRAFSRVKCRILEWNKTDNKFRYLSNGWMAIAIRNPDGNEGLVQVSLRHIKNQLDIRLGIPALDRCGNVLGDPKTCQVNLVPLRQSGTVIVVDQNLVTITGLTPPQNLWFNRGYVTYKGLSLLIREWTSGTDFLLNQIPPNSWIGQTVIVTPGCNKESAVCGGTWNNLSRFMGNGAAMVDYNPTFENPGS